jgi:hypothetical protein
MCIQNYCIKNMQAAGVKKPAQMEGRRGVGFFTAVKA